VTRSEEIDADVAVIGGGPAGLSAGARLARSGYVVDLYEEHPDIGEPVHCTGVLAADAFDVFDVPRGTVLNELRTVRFHAPGGSVVEYATPRVEAVVIDRARFDRQLAQAALAAGVRVQRARVVGLAIDAARGVTVTAGGGVRRARVALLACGANYALHRRLGLGLPRLMLQTAQAELPAHRLGPVEVHFGRDAAPGGFAWAVPVDRGTRPSVRIGVMCEADAASRFRRIAAAVAPRWGIERRDICAPRQKVLPLAPIPRTYADRVLALGDAAGLVKPTTGGGIYYSLLSAQLAADTLGPALAADTLGAQHLAAYETAWRRHLGTELRWQLVLRRAVQRLSDRDIDRLFELAHTDGIMPIVRRTATFNRHREFIVALLKHPPARRVLFRAAFA
jgi:geranylgeranyl reductase family protein